MLVFYRWLDYSCINCCRFSSLDPIIQIFPSFLFNGILINSKKMGNLLADYSGLWSLKSSTLWTIKIWIFNDDKWCLNVPLNLVIICDGERKFWMKNYLILCSLWHETAMNFRPELAFRIIHFQNCISFKNLLFIFR